MSPLAVCTLYSARALFGGDPHTSPRVVEAAMVAQAQTRFFFPASEVVHRNADAGLILADRPYHFMREVQTAEADFCLKAKHIAPEDSVVVIGAGDGWFPLRLKEHGVREVAAFEPQAKDRVSFEDFLQKTSEAMGRPLSAAEKENFDALLPMTGSEFVESHPGKQFSVVIASSFHPVPFIGARSYQQVFGQSLADMWGMTQPSI